MRQISLGPVFLLGTGSHGFYFRILGCGLYFEWTGELTFSERMGLTHYFRVGKLVVRALKP